MGIVWYDTRLQLIVAVIILLSCSSCASVHLAGDRVSDVRELLLLLLKLLGGSGSGVLLEPLGGLLDGVENSLLILLIDLTIGLSASASPFSYVKGLRLTLPIPHRR